MKYVLSLLSFYVVISITVLQIVIVDNLLSSGMACTVRPVRYNVHGMTCTVCPVWYDLHSAVSYARYDLHGMTRMA